MTEPVRIGVAGCGYWGRNLVRTFAGSERARLVAIADTSADVRARITKAHPGVTAYESTEHLLRHADLEAVAIATPASTHVDLALAALRAGKDVFVEKPLALDLEGARTIDAAARTSGRVVQVGHLLRYHPAVESLDEMIQRGDVGDIHYVYARRVNLGRVRQEENALWSLGPHDVSIIVHLLRAEPVEVVAIGESYLQPGVADVVFLAMRFADGRMAHVQLSWLDPHKERQITVVGSRRMVTFDDAHPSDKIRVYDKGIDRKREYASFAEFLSLRDGDIHLPRVPTAEPLAVECHHFLDCVRTRARPRTDTAEGMRVVAVLEAAQRSLDQRGVAVRLGADGVRNAAVR